MVKPTQSDPPWIKQAVRRLEWQALLTWLGTAVIALGAVVAGGSFFHKAPEWMLVMLMPQILLFGWIRLAYRRGIRDAEEHSRKTSDAATRTI
jgi:hypothetical protein